MAKKKLHRVTPGPNPKTENPQPYYKHAGRVFEIHFKRRPSRTTLAKYLNDGFPIRRGGPYVRMPTYIALKQHMTTKEAMQRFITVVRHLEEKI